MMAGRAYMAAKGKRKVALCDLSRLYNVKRISNSPVQKSTRTTRDKRIVSLVFKKMKTGKIN